MNEAADAAGAMVIAPEHVHTSRLAIDILNNIEIFALFLLSANRREGLHEMC